MRVGTIVGTIVDLGGTVGEVAASEQDNTNAASNNPIEVLIALLNDPFVYFLAPAQTPYPILMPPSTMTWEPVM